MRACEGTRVSSLCQIRKGKLPDSHTSWVNRAEPKWEREIWRRRKTLSKQKRWGRKNKGNQEGRRKDDRDTTWNLGKQKERKKETEAESRKRAAGNSFVIFPTLCPPKTGIWQYSSSSSFSFPCHSSLIHFPSFYSCMAVSHVCMACTSQSATMTRFKIIWQLASPLLRYFTVDENC